jgi:hypothetical protein
MVEPIVAHCLLDLSNESSGWNKAIGHSYAIAVGSTTYRALAAAALDAAIELRLLLQGQHCRMRQPMVLE